MISDPLSVSEMARILECWDSGFSDVEDRLEGLSAEGDPLEKLSAMVDFKTFRSLPETRPI